MLHIELLAVGAVNIKMGKLILMQRTVDYVYSIDKNAVLRFEQLGIPEVKETESGTKYYSYE